MTVSKISYTESVAQLPLPATTKWPNGVWDIELFKRGDMALILYTPRIYDYQTPHGQDEVYIVFKGSGQLVTPAATFHFTEGDVLFVPAGDEHRFENFTDDTALWVVFWGPKGGEK